MFCKADALQAVSPDKLRTFVHTYIQMYLYPGAERDIFNGESGRLFSLTCTNAYCYVYILHVTTRSRFKQLIPGRHQSSA